MYQARVVKYITGCKRCTHTHTYFSICVLIVRHIIRSEKEYIAYTHFIECERRVRVLVRRSLPPRARERQSESSRAIGRGECNRTIAWRSLSSQSEQESELASESGASATPPKLHRVPMTGFTWHRTLTVKRSTPSSPPTEPAQSIQNPNALCL